MRNTNQAIVDNFFAAYSKHDMDGIREVMDENVKWYFMGQHPLAGVKNGITEVIEFFDRVGKIMGESKPSINKLIVAENENYFIECIHSKTNRSDDNNLEHFACVLWTFGSNGGSVRKITEGRHFFSDADPVNRYFNSVVTNNA